MPLKIRGIGKRKFGVGDGNEFGFGHVEFEVSVNQPDEDIS